MEDNMARLQAVIMHYEKALPRRGNYQKKSVTHLEKLEKKLAHYIELLQNLHRPPQLSLSAIDDQQVRQNRESFIHLFARGIVFMDGAPAPKPAREHFFHRREIIRTDYRFDIEVPVILLIRNPLRKDDHTANRCGPLSIRNIVALDLI